MSEQWPDELSLDDAQGPAPYITPKAQEALLQDVLAQAYPRRKRAGWLVAAIALACVGGGSASAAVYWYAHREIEPAPKVEAPKVPVARVAPKPVAQEPVVQEPVVQEPPVVKPVVLPRPPIRASEDWLRDGNQLRAARKWKQADDAYGEAARRAPNDAAAYVAFVASAGVRLEHLGDARGALHRYRAALTAAPNGALDEEIRFGIADAYKALGDVAHEREALETFLREHAQSPLAAQARERLR